MMEESTIDAMTAITLSIVSLKHMKILEDLTQRSCSEPTAVLPMKGKPWKSSHM